MPMCQKQEVLVYLLMTIFYKDQTFSQHVYTVESFPGNDLAMRMSHTSTASIEIDKKLRLS